MARGRMLDRRFTESKKLQALPRDYRLVYASILPFLDREGRIIGEPIYLKAICFRHTDFDAAEIGAAIHALAQAGLIDLYADDDNAAIVQYVGFDRFNSPNAKEAKSDLPGPGEEGVEPARDPLIRKAPAHAPAMHVQRTGIASGERNGTSTSTSTNNGTEPSPADLAATPPSETDPSTLAGVWNTYRGPLPEARTISAGREKALKRFAKEHGPNAPAMLADAAQAVASNDFWIRKQYGLDELLAGDKVTKYADKWRAGVTQLGEANIRMATQVDRWARALDQVDERPVN